MISWSRVLLHRGQHDLGDLLQGGEIPDHALVSFRQVLYLLIGEGIFDGVDDDAGHGEQSSWRFSGSKGRYSPLGLNLSYTPRVPVNCPLKVRGTARQ